MKVSEQEFDVLGFHFTPYEQSVAGKTIVKFKERIVRLYEQDTDSKRIGEYVKR